MAREAGGGEVWRGGVDRRDCERGAGKQVGLETEVDVNLVKYRTECVQGLVWMFFRHFSSFANF